ncbi:MotA/TolQ/ExbB proton channel family protein [Shewanella intestini]|uniref:MotA/TolQ/ExbB proton channel family protein n=1 Tax=Shewanella intestini TaxID=2017544 RepID=A0ABS5I035_9GAMM|nr:MULTISPECIES: MotA/TolQ/ExbB proton channel family protein [Shewanella]MBR9727393.1 MotA/TolQ/ExbB proton channel family protein [Shewanella intestini]MRG35557.1 hypothetical protein [Shewanella sp. XMDDZSB0408]
MKLLTLIMLTLLLSFSGHASTMQQYEAQLSAELKQAQQQYQQQVDKVSRQRQPMLTKLTVLEADLLALRQQLIGQTRSKDDAYLSVQAMEQRLTQWQDQNRYIHNLLSHHAGNREGDAIKLIEQEMSSIGDKLSPKWHPSQAIAKNGALEQGELLRLGPLGFLHHNGQLSLLDIQVTEQNNVPKISLTIDSARPSQVLPIDITGNRVITIEANHKSIIDQIKQGGFWVYPILLMGAIALVMALIKALQLHQQPKADCGLVARYLQSGVIPATKGWQVELLQQAQQHRGCGSEAMGDYLHQYLLGVKNKQDKGMAMIAATAAVAPLMGLLGTVSGMIQTFEMMNLFGNQDSSVLSGGISEALVTTELGLVVAIPSLLLHAWLSRRHQGMLSQLEADAGVLCQLGDNTGA